MLVIVVVIVIVIVIVVCKFGRILERVCEFLIILYNSSNIGRGRT